MCIAGNANILSAFAVSDITESAEKKAPVLSGRKEGSGTILAPDHIRKWKIKTPS